MAGTKDQGPRTKDQFALVGVLLLADVAPFETSTPLVRVPGQSISDLEAVMLIAFGIWGAGILVARAWPEWRTPLTAPWLALLAVAALASVVSQISRANALHMTGRLAAAFGVYLLTVNAITSRGRARTLLAVMLTTGLVVSVLAILEYRQVPAVLQLLRAFRPGLSTVGAQLRAGGPLQYPTIASMYLEVVFAFGVGVLLTELDGNHRVLGIAAFVALLVVAEAITLTYTRAGLIAMGATLAIVAAVRYRHRGVDAGVGAVAALAFGVVALFAVSRSAESIRLRLTSEGQESWYRAEIEAPLTVALPTGRDEIIPVTVRNTGRLVWDSRDTPPFYFSYHWVAADRDRIVSFDGVRTPFEAPVNPGEDAVVLARVRSPRQPGDYRLSWDVVQEGRLWFSTEPGARQATSQAHVVGGAITTAAQTFPPPKPTVRPGRLQLWRAALAMFARHPWLGVGPDNFRLSYGPYAGIAAPDPRTHSNNMYLEVLAGTGLAGAVAFVWLAWSAGRSVSADVGVLCALAAIALHGVVDSFLSFAPTYVLFAITLGLTRHENRV